MESVCKLQSFEKVGRTRRSAPEQTGLSRHGALRAVGPSALRRARPTFLRFFAAALVGCWINDSGLYAIEAHLANVLTAERLKPKGEYYDATVPDTLDLAERARLSVHGL